MRCGARTIGLLGFGRLIVWYAPPPETVERPVFRWRLYTRPSPAAGVLNGVRPMIVPSAVVQAAGAVAVPLQMREPGKLFCALMHAKSPSGPDVGYWHCVPSGRSPFGQKMPTVPPRRLRGASANANCPVEQYFVGYGVGEAAVTGGGLIGSTRPRSRFGPQTCSAAATAG